MADLSITAASVLQSANGVVARGVAGATLTAGMPVYLDTADNKLKPADANGTAPLNSVRGITVNGAADGQFVNYVTEDPNFVAGATLTAGVIYVLSATAGKICPAADLASGHTSIVLGVAKSASVLALKITTGGALA
jgi:hypothetical protein